MPTPNKFGFLTSGKDEGGDPSVPMSAMSLVRCLRQCSEVSKGCNLSFVDSDGRPVSASHLIMSGSKRTYQISGRTSMSLIKWQEFQDDNLPFKVIDAAGTPYWISTVQRTSDALEIKLMRAN